MTRHNAFKLLPWWLTSLTVLTVFLNCLKLKFSVCVFCGSITPATGGMPASTFKQSFQAMTARQWRYEGIGIAAMI